MEFDEIALRPCNLQDCEALALIGGATFLESFAGILDGGAIVAHCAKVHSAQVYQKYLGDLGAKAWLAEAKNGGAPVGYAMLSRPELPLSGVGPLDIELKRIYLFSRFHGRGAGKQLLDQAIAEAHSLGMKRLLLGVFAENHRALAFYRRNGFEDLGRRVFQIGNQQCNDLILSRTL